MQIDTARKICYRKSGMSLFRNLCFCVCTLAVIAAVALYPAAATDWEAAQMTQQALAMAQRGGVCEHEEAFRMIYEAWSHAETDECRKIVERNLSKMSDALARQVVEHRPDFLDQADKARENIYKVLAAYGDARGKRLYSDTLFERDPAQAMKLIVEAANAGDGPACHIVAFCCLYGFCGMECNGTNAFRWLQAAADAHYAPAWEKLAELYWNGDADWGVARQQMEALHCLQNAIVLYRRWTLDNEEEQKKLENYCSSLQHIRDLMDKLIGRGFVGMHPHFYPSFLALRLSYYSESDSGLRARMYYINEYLRRFCKTHHLNELPALQLEYIPIHLANLGPGVYGMQSSRYAEEYLIHQKIEIYPEHMPSLENSTGEAKERAYWEREMTLNSSIAHELGHAYFGLRYSADYGNTEYGKPLMEGHAISVEYSFLELAYMNGNFPAEDMAARESASYAGYFRWYRLHCTDSEGYTDWDAVERYAKLSGGVGKVMRTQAVGKYGLQYKPKYFDLLFLGYM